jgi:hypothetical protein
MDASSLLRNGAQALRQPAHLNYGLAMDVFFLQHIFGQHPTLTYAIRYILKKQVDSRKHTNGHPPETLALLENYMFFDNPA